MCTRRRWTYRAINVGGNNENYQVRDVADQVQRLAPQAKIAYTGEVGADPRNYRVKTSACPDLLHRCPLPISKAKFASKMLHFFWPE